MSNWDDQNGWDVGPQDNWWDQGVVPPEAPQFPTGQPAPQAWDSAPDVAQPPPVQQAPAPTWVNKDPNGKAVGSQWLNWIHDTYGDSQSRGGGFADLPGGTNGSSVIDRFNRETGNNAKYLGGPSGDQVDFGQGAQDFLTSGGQLWLNKDPGSHGAAGGGSGSAPGGGQPFGTQGGGASGSQGGWAPSGDLSALIDQKYMDIVSGKGGNSEFGKTLQDALSGILKNGGKGTPMNAAEFESIRQPIEKGRRAQTNQAMAELASRGIIGEGAGHQSGPEREALSRIESEIAPDWASALQRASTEHDKLGMGLFGQALGTGEQEAGRETSQILDAMQGATGRQTAISQIALQNLEQNRMWNQFLAQFGLDQQKVAADIQNGNVANIIPLLQMFSKNADTSAGGYV